MVLKYSEQADKMAVQFIGHIGRTGLSLYSGTDLMLFCF